MKRFERVKMVLEEAVGGQTIMAHGNFWRDLTLEQFKTKKIFGKKLVEPGNSEASNLIKALEGTPPFGLDTGTPGALFNRMPSGLSAVEPNKIAIIRKWIDDGCPDEEEQGQENGETRDQQLTRYNAYWRDFDNWSLFNRTPEIDDAINEFFPLAEVWMAAAKREIPQSDWVNAISTPAVQAAVGLLGSRILETIRGHFGNPVSFDEILESYQLFGADKLPDDPLRPNDPRHNMNGAMMWFFYTAFVDASLRLGTPPERDELTTLGRAVIGGLLNDGLFRGRFPVKGFTADEEGAAAVNLFIRSLSENDLQAEMSRRFVDTQQIPARPADTNIIELMKVPKENHDLNWLETSLQAALKLELSTIPPYLCALWSIIEPDPNVESYHYKTIRGIVIDEMFHMGLVCNMLTTLGVTPKINDSETVPTYPGPLPGGVNPNLVVPLRKLCKPQLEVFLEIEKPEHEPIMPIESLGEEFATIGEFYNAILEAFRMLPTSDFKNERQLTIDDRLIPIKNISDVEAAIARIKKQGEGTIQKPEDEEDLTEPDLAHYYRFREFLWERRFVKNADEKWINGDPLPLPEVYEMAEIPGGGYPESKDFDLLYTELLNSLQRAWEEGSNGVLGGAIGLMFEMRELAQILMQTPLDPENPSLGNFGPSFLLISQ